MFYFDAWVYDLGASLELPSVLLLLKYFEIVLFFLLRFCRERWNRWSDLFYLCRLGLVDFFVILTNSQLDFQSKFGRNFPPKQVRLLISIERVLVNIIYQRDKIPYGLANTVKFSDFICLWRIDLFVRYVLSHKVERVLDVLSIQSQAFYRSMKRNGVETTIPEFWFSGCMWCYELRSLGLDNRTTLVLSNTRELDRVPKTK